jgi:hypothetical protein
MIYARLQTLKDTKERERDRNLEEYQHGPSWLAPDAEPDQS